MQFHVKEDAYGNVDVKLGYKTKDKLRKLALGVVYGIGIASTGFLLNEKRKNKNTDEQ